MTKQGGSIKTWKRRWFVLKGSNLYYFKTNKSDAEAKGVIDLADRTVVRKEEKHGKKHAFAIYTAKRVFFMYPDQASETDAWINAVQKAIDRMKGPRASTVGMAPVNPGGLSAPGAGASGRKPREIMNTAKKEVYFLKEDADSKMHDFWQIWMESIPDRSELVAPGFIDFEVAVAADLQKLGWKTSGPQNIFIQRMVDFFWNVGAPESEIDRLNDVGALINPTMIGSWIDMSSKGGMDGGWYFPTDIPLKFALEASDPGDPTARVAKWGELHAISTCYSVSRDMGAAPPRQTEVRFRMAGVGFEEQLGHALSAFSAFGFPNLPDEAVNIIRSSPKLGIRLSVVTSSEGFVRIGLLVPDPDFATVEKLCPMSGAPSSEPLRRFAACLQVQGPNFVEFQFLNKGFGYGVYKEGFDVVFHYHVGREEP